MAAHPISVNSAKETLHKLSVFPSRRFQPRRYRPGGQGPWSGHLPFANDLAAALRPAVFVELGTHYGESYFGFCQAMEENGIDCACYAVDTWQGDAHSGFYDESVFQDVREYNRANYAAFSSLIRSTFEQAHPQFADASVDLLHIDGLHTYEAVKKDFNLWLPKMRPGGVVLLHDINVRHAGFEVWKFWQELCDTYDGFEFNHSWGLGVLRLPGGVEPAPELISALFACSPEDRQAIREHYAFAADYLELKWRTEQNGAAEPPKSFLQVFGDSAGTHREAASARAELKPGAWVEYTVELAQGSDSHELRLDLADRPCVIELSAITVRSSTDHMLLVQYAKRDELNACRCAGDLMPLPGAEHARFLSYGNDPQLLVQAPAGARLNQPLLIQISMRVLESLEAAAPAREPQADNPGSLESAMMERTLALNRVETMRAELRHEQTGRLALVSEFRRAKAERDALDAQFDGLRTSLMDEQDLRVRLEHELALLRLTAARQEAELARAQPRPELEQELVQLRARGEEERDRRTALESECALLRVNTARVESELAQTRTRMAELTEDRAYLEARLRDEKALSLSLASQHEGSRKQLERDLSLVRMGMDRLQSESDYAAGLNRALEENRTQLIRERADWTAQRSAMDRKFNEALQQEHRQAQAALASASAERAGREDVLRSYSWRITRPLRAVLGLFRR